MNITTEEKVSEYEVEDWILSNVDNLTSCQKMQIHELFNDGWFEFSVYQSNDKRVSFIDRLSTIALIILLVLMFLSMPLKWMFTGLFHYKSSSRFVKYVDGWRRCLGL